MVVTKEYRVHPSEGRSEVVTFALLSDADIRCLVLYKRGLGRA
jgi:hypothetical protein